MGSGITRGCPLEGAGLFRGLGACLERVAFGGAGPAGALAGAVLTASDCGLTPRRRLRARHGGRTLRARRLPQRGHLRQRARRRLSLPVPGGRRLRGSALRSGGSLLPAQFFRHVPRPAAALPSHAVPRVGARPHLRACTRSPLPSRPRFLTAPPWRPIGHRPLPSLSHHFLSHPSLGELPQTFLSQGWWV